MPRVTRPLRILIARTDAVGDNVVTLPVADDCKAALPGCHVAWIAKPAVAPLIRLDRNVDEVIPWHDTTDPAPLLPQLRSFDAAVVVHPKPKRWSPFAAALRQAGIRVRVGTGRRWWGLLLYTHRMWESRHRHGMHECARARHHGRVALTALGADPAVCDRPARTGLAIPAELDAGAAAWLNGTRGFALLHVGSNGSSVDWPLPHMAALADRLDAAGIPVVVSTGFRRQDLEAEVRRHARRSHRFTDPELPLADLCALVARAACVVANSTGPLHLAGGLGVRSVGLFPNMKDCFPEQWGPIGGRSVDLVAPPPPGGTYRKRGTAEPGHMAGITVDQVEAAVRHQCAAA